MRLCTAFLVIFPFYSWAFAPATSKVGTATSTTLEARRVLFPTLRRPSLLFPDFDRMFDEVDEMMENSLAATRSSLLLNDDTSKGLALKRPLGFDVTQDGHEYKVEISVPDVEAKDLNLQLDHDGRVLRLKGDKVYEEGGMKVQSRFEKAILLSPDIDTSQLHANMDKDTLTVIAPKFDPKDLLEKVDTNKADKKIEIQFSGPALGPSASTKLPVETLKDSDVKIKESTDTATPEQKWPVRDFPY